MMQTKCDLHLCLLEKLISFTLCVSFLSGICSKRKKQTAFSGQMVGSQGGGGGTLLFSRIRRLGLFFGVQNSEFQYFLRFSEK